MTLKDPTEKRRVFIFNLALLAVFALLTVGGWWLGGVDFAKATLVGCIVVAINFFVSQRLVTQFIAERTARLNLLIVYLFKLAVSVLILFVAVTRLQLDPVGLMLGLSSIIVATVISTLLRGKTPETKPDGD
jgi:hypothetical protein